MALLDLAIDTAGSGLAIVVHTREPAELEAQVSGSAEMPAAAVMMSLVQALHAHAQSLAVATVTVDFTNLEFMSSSCFKSLVSWVNDITELPEPERYKLRFRTNTAIPWQRRSLHALQTMAKALVTVEA